MWQVSLAGTDVPAGLYVWSYRIKRLKLTSELVLISSIIFYSQSSSFDIAWANIASSGDKSKLTPAIFASIQCF